MKIRTLKHLAAFKSRLLTEELREKQAAARYPKLDRYVDSWLEQRWEQRWVTISKIIVPTDRDKDQLLMALNYLHDCYVDTDIMAVNTLVHTYTDPDLIVVEPPNA